MTCTPGTVEDAFDRADTSSGLGTADTGQTWVPVLPFILNPGTPPGIGTGSGTVTVSSPEEPLGILSNQAYSPEPTNYDPFTVSDTARIRGEVIDVGTPELTTWTWDTHLDNGWGGTQSGALVRYVDEDNFTCVALEQNVGAFLGRVSAAVIECVAGSFSTLLWSVGGGVIGASTGTYTSVLSLIGSVLSLDVTSPTFATVHHETTATRLSGNKHGLHIRNFEVGQPLIDNLNLTYCVPDDFWVQGMTMHQSSHYWSQSLAMR